MQDKILAYLRKIPQGRVVTYGQIAAALGDPKLARAVGNALHRNPDGEKYPCYKVVSARGKLSESFAFGGLEKSVNFEAHYIEFYGQKTKKTKENPPPS